MIRANAGRGRREPIELLLAKRCSPKKSVNVNKAARDQAMPVREKERRSKDRSDTIQKSQE